MAKDTDRRRADPGDLDEREKRNAGLLDDRPSGRDYEEPDEDESAGGEDGPERIWVRGEGGGLLVFDLPLPLGIQHRIDHGFLARVNEDGTTWVPSRDEDGEGEPEPPYGDRLPPVPGRPADADDPRTGPQAGDNPVIAGRRADLPGEPPEGYEPDDGDEDKPGDAPALPKKTASKDAWVEFAVSQGMGREDAAGMTRDELAGEFTKERKAP